MDEVPSSLSINRKLCLKILSIIFIASTRLIWIMVCTIGILNATALVFTFWERHISNPTQISIETDHAPVVELEFPAITFCHINQISEMRAMQLLKIL